MGKLRPYKVMVLGQDANLLNCGSSISTKNCLAPRPVCRSGVWREKASFPLLLRTILEQILVQGLKGT